MRPYFSKQKKSGHQNGSQIASNISFDSFIFTDNLTNSKIVVKDAHKQYQNKQKIKRCKRISNQSQIQNLNQCINSLKTTKLFQMNSLRNKLFKTSLHTRNSTLEGEIQAINQTKHGLRQLIDISVTQASIKQLRQCIQNPNHRVNPHIMRLQYIKDCSLTKNNIMSIINGSQKKYSFIEGHQMSKHHQTSKETVIQEEQQLRQKVDHFIVNMKNKNSFLVSPDRKHQLYQKLYTACSNKKMALKKKKPVKACVSLGQEGVFKPIDAGKKVQNFERMIKQKQNISVQSQEQKQILYAVENNLFFDLQFLVNSCKNLINTRDRMGNNLLHIAAKNRNDFLFQFILKQISSQALEAKNNLGKTPIDVAKMYGVKQIVSIIENYSPFQYQQAIL